MSGCLIGSTATGPLGNDAHFSHVPPIFAFLPGRHRPVLPDDRPVSLDTALQSFRILLQTSCLAPFHLIARLTRTCVAVPLSLLAANPHIRHSWELTRSPSEVVPLLKPSLRAKGLHIGTYTLAPVAPPAENSSDSKVKRLNRRIIISELLEPGNPAPKYEFEMELSLRETSRGRWNKLDITSYQSVNLATGEVLGLALKHQKPFYFSK